MTNVEDTEDDRALYWTPNDFSQSRKDDTSHSHGLRKDM